MSLDLSDRHWTGLTTCLCTHCGELFTNPRAFDMHYNMNQRTGEMTCHDPATMIRGDNLPVFKRIEKPEWNPPYVWTRNDPRGDRHGGNWDGDEDA